MLRHTLPSSIDTLQDFELAAEDKYWEGTELLLAGHRAGGIYLLGYTAEMILKAAGFRFQGHGPATPVAGPFAPARRFMGARQPAVACESYHSLQFWMHYLRQQRSARGRPLPAPLDAALVQRTRRLYLTWWVEMRYRADQAQPADASNVYNDVSWLRANRLALWS